MNTQAIIIWIAGMPISYFINRWFFRSVDNWTIGTRNIVIIMTILGSYASAISSIICFLISRQADNDKKANW